MSRYRRSRDGNVYFFTLVTQRRRPLLVDARARLALRNAFRETRRARPFTVLAIVLLPDHLHAVWELPTGDADFSTRWAEIKGRFTRAWLATGGVDTDVSVSRSLRGERGIWQCRFFEHTVRGERDLRRCVDYLHVNPVKRRLVERVRDWPWSSFHRFVRMGEYDLEWGSSSEWYGDEFDAYE